MKLNKKHRREQRQARADLHAMLRERRLTKVGCVNITYFAGFSYLWRERRNFPQILGRELLAVKATVRALELAMVLAIEEAQLSGGAP
jgi:hypothetical protein